MDGCEMMLGVNKEDVIVCSSPSSSSPLSSFMTIAVRFHPSIDPGKCCLFLFFFFKWRGGQDDEKRKSKTPKAERMDRRSASLAQLGGEGGEGGREGGTIRGNHHCH